jgi:hypothetical protein
MATAFLSDQATKYSANPPQKINPNEGSPSDAGMIFFSKTLAASGLAIGDTIELCKIPAGVRVVGLVFSWDTAQGGTATMAIGISGTTGKYFTAALTNALTQFSGANTIVQNYGSVTTAEETILATNAAAAWTVSTTLRGHFIVVPGG